MNEMLKGDYLSLQEIVNSFPPATPVMPLTHGTGSVNFFVMLAQGLIRAGLCDVYNEDLVYLFYARPAYRPGSGILNTGDNSFRPVSFILNPDAIGGARRIVSLDSGAFHRGFFSSHVAPQLAKENFELQGGLNAPQKCVSAFFGSNMNYYFGRANPKISLKPTEIAGQSYLGILRSTVQLTLDDRRGTIEFQFSSDIPLNKETVMAIAMPTDYMDDDNLVSFILHELQAEIIGYDVYHDRPVHDVHEIIARVKDYYKSRGYL